MRVILITIILCLISLQLDAKKAGSLSDAVNQAKKEGRVLSARTINGRHEVKVLTNSGTVKIINKKAAGSSFGNTNQSPSEYYNKEGKSNRNLNRDSSRSRNSTSRNRNSNSLAPSRFNSQRKSMKIDSQRNRSNSSSSKKSSDNSNNKKNR